MSAITITTASGATITCDSSEVAAIEALLAPKAAQATVEAPAKAKVVTEASTGTYLRMKTRKDFIAAHDWAEQGTSTDELARMVVQGGAPLADGWLVGDGYRAKHGDAEAAKRNEARNTAKDAKAEVKAPAKKKSAKRSAAAKKAAASKPRVNGKFAKADAKAEVVAEVGDVEGLTVSQKAEIVKFTAAGWSKAEALELLDLG